MINDITGNRLEKFSTDALKLAIEMLDAGIQKETGFLATIALNELEKRISEKEFDDFLDYLGR